MRVYNHIYRAVFDYGKPLAELKGHEGHVVSLRFSPDGTTLATTGRDDSTVRLWKVREDYLPKQPKKLEAQQGKIKSVRFSPDGKLFATAEENGQIKIWNINGKLSLQSSEYESIVNSVRFSSNKKKISSADSKGVVKLWDYLGNELRKLKEFQTRQGNIESVNFNHRGDRLATGAKNSVNQNGVNLWSLDGGLIRSYRLNGKVYGVRFSSNNEKLSATGEEGMVALRAIFLSVTPGFLRLKLKS